MNEILAKRTEPFKEKNTLYLWVNPKRCWGDPCILGHRLAPRFVAGRINGGDSIESVAKDYGLSEKTVRLCVYYDDMQKIVYGEEKK
jgi:uncharacterized protein (DUF433 family)